MPTQNSLSFHTDRRLRPALRQRPAEHVDGNGRTVSNRVEPALAAAVRQAEQATPKADQEPAWPNRDVRPAKAARQAAREQASLDQPTGLNHP